MGMKFADLERNLIRIKEMEGPNAPKYAYCEVGRYKPYSIPVIKAAERRGYKVECKIRGALYYVYPK
jgi:hypothetical protein